MTIRRALAAITVTTLGACFLIEAHAGPKQSTIKKAGSAQAASEGERRFRTNCGRCHNPPETIRPSEVRAVARHMRVRAMLTTEDEKLISEYLAP
jgi:hypothetical protein